MNKQFSKLLNQISDTVHASQFSKIILVAVMMAPALSHAAPDPSLDPAAYKYPRQIAFVAELPKTATGKIQRFKLREQEAITR